MVVLPSKRLLLVAFLLICFFSLSASARSLRDTRNEHGKGQIGVFDQKLQSQGGEQLNGEDLVTMDYTPAKKNPPIHN